MKKLLAILLIPLAAFAASAPTYRVDNVGNVYEIAANGDETNLGALGDVTANNPSKAPGIKAAAATWQAKVQADAAAQVKAAQDSAAAQVAAKETELAAAKAYVEKLKAALTAAGQPVPNP